MTNRWTIEAVRTDSGEAAYVHREFPVDVSGLLSAFGGLHARNGTEMDIFKGRIIHPQRWPDDLDLSGKKVVVIGSGATAATLIPAIADECGHVTMLQRSPTYFRTGRNAIELAETLRQLQISEEWIHEIVRRKILFEQDTFTRRSFDGARSRQAGAARRYSRRARSRFRCRHRQTFYAELPAMAAAHRLRARCRSVRGYQERQGLGCDRRNRSLQREPGILLKSGQSARRRHHRHRDRV